MCKFSIHLIILLTFLLIAGCINKKKEVTYCNLNIGNDHPNFKYILCSNHGQYVDSIHKYKILLLDKTFTIENHKISGEGDALEITLLTPTNDIPEGNYNFSSTEQPNTLFDGYFAKKINFSEQTVETISIVNSGEINIFRHAEYQTLLKLTLSMTTNNGDSINGSLLLPFIVK